MRMRRGMLSMEVLVMIAIALIVLFLAFYMVTTRSSVADRSLNDCVANNGVCKQYCDGMPTGYTGCPEGQSCCVEPG
ncbi:hypothetical protein JXB02_03905 [Candidatus Woesearchaeota archaeon]|nr:hypothetical protein [Candidatus Woesearchaeota archaeon]